MTGDIYIYIYLDFYGKKSTSVILILSSLVAVNVVSKLSSVADSFKSEGGQLRVQSVPCAEREWTAAKAANRSETHLCTLTPYPQLNQPRITPHL